MLNKKVRSIFVRVLSVSAAFLLFSGMAFSVLFPTAPSGAMSDTQGAEVGVNVKEFIKLAVDKSALALADTGGHTTISPSPEGTPISGQVNVAVTTNTIKGYDLSVYTQDTSNGMIHENANVDTEIEAVDTITGYDGTTGISALSNNTWGFQKSAKGGAATGNWFAVGESSSLPTSIDSVDEEDSDFCADLAYPLNSTGCSVDTYATYNINFGAKLTSELPAGTYRNNVVFSAVAKSEGVRYTLNFGANGGQNTMGPRTILAGSTVTLPTKGFVKDGYGILGWALVDNATASTTPLYTAGQTVQVDTLRAAATAAGQDVETNRSLTLYAVWDKEYTVRYNPGSQDASGSTSSSTALFQNNVTLRANGFSRTGYGFLGWALTSGASTADYNAGQSVSMSTLISAAQTAGQTVTDTVDLYAVWGTTYTLTYNLNGGSGTIADQTGIALSDTAVPISMTEPTRDNYNFKGWAYTSSATSGNAELWTEGQSSQKTVSMSTLISAAAGAGQSVSTSSPGTVTLYAVWELSQITYTLAVSNTNGYGKDNIPSTQTYTAPITETSHTFTIPSTAPTPKKPWGFSSYSYGGNTYSPGSTITLTSSSPSATLSINWTKTCQISASQGCQFEDNKIWILGNSGNAITWNNMFTGATNQNNHNATVKSGICPAGYSAPTIVDYDNLIIAYGGTPDSIYRNGYRERTGALYSMLGLSTTRYFWSSTESSSSYVYSLNVGSSSSYSSSLNHKDNNNYVLCCK